MIGIGAYLWFVAKKTIAGIILLAVGLLLTSAPIALIAFVTITNSARE
jgi:type III secretory pathway component EscR